MGDFNSLLNRRAGKRLAELRRAAGMSQTELAKHLGAMGLPFRHQPRITQLESGARILTRDEAEAIAEIIDVDVATFFEGTDDDDIEALRAQQDLVIAKINNRVRQALQLKRSYERKVAELDEENKSDVARATEIENQIAKIENGEANTTKGKK